MRQLTNGIHAAAVSAVLLGLTGCDVERTRSGAMPDVDVEAGRWPQYDVDWADVNVGTTQRTITVPVVRVVEETREISVPFIDINPPGASDLEERTVSIEIDVPHAGYQLAITEVRAAGDDLWVIGTLTESGPASTQVVTRMSDQVVVRAPDDLDVRKAVIGQRPPGVYNQQYRFVDSMSALEGAIPDGARVVYQRRP